MRNWGRKVRVELFGDDSTLVINQNKRNDNDLKVEFSIMKSIGLANNSASIKIYNLQEKHRNMASNKEYNRIRVSAGYVPDFKSLVLEEPSNLGTILQADIHDVQHTRSGVDIVTTFKCSEGNNATIKAVHNKTYPAGASYKDVINGLYNELSPYGINQGQFILPDFDDFKRPYTVSSSVTRELNNQGRGKKFYAHIDGNTLNIHPSDGFLFGDEPLINENTGLIGIPTTTDKGLKFQSLLNPAIKAGYTIKAQSNVVELKGEDGKYRVDTVGFRGNNRDGTYVAVVNSVPIIAGKAQEGRDPDNIVSRDSLNPNDDSTPGRGILAKISRAVDFGSIKDRVGVSIDNINFDETGLSSQQQQQIRDVLKGNLT